MTLFYHSHRPTTGYGEVARCLFAVSTRLSSADTYRGNVNNFPVFFFHRGVYSLGDTWKGFNFCMLAIAINNADKIACDLCIIRDIYRPNIKLIYIYEVSI